MSFLNNEPPAQKKTQQQRLAFAMGFEGFLKNNLAQASPANVLACPAFGSDVDEQNVGHNLMTASSPSRNDSEQLGEHGAIYLLQSFLSKNNMKYDDNCLRVFAGPNTFNLVYVYPDCTNPNFAIVLEAKGGNSQLGSRTDPITGATVKQGTKAYLHTELSVMANSKGQDKQSFANAVQKCMGKAPPKVFYIGVQTKYDTKKNEIYDPVPIFCVDA